MSWADDFNKVTGFRNLFRCRHCGELVHAREAQDQAGVLLILQAHKTFNCRFDPLDALLCGAA